MPTKETDPYRLDELSRREGEARAMGGEDKIARQHAKGRLTARERIHQLLDPGSFDEQGLLAHSDLPEAADKTPADGKVAGFGRIDSRTVFVGADDVTVMAGAGGRIGVGKLFRGMKYAAEKGIPCIQLGDAGGARVPDIMGSTGMMSMVYPIKDAPPRDRRVPLITAILGECFGGSAWTASISDIVIQVKGTAMCVGGPSILEVATGEKASTEELGGWKLHANVTGQVDLFADNEYECLALIRRVLAYLPNNANEMPPALLPADIQGMWTRHGAASAASVGADADRLEKENDRVEGRIENITAIVPADPRQAYDMHRLMEAVFDPGSLLELKPFFDGSLITALARLDGQVVGVLANNPKVTAGAMGPGACEKAVSFICLCDSFHIPLLFMHDTPGFFVGKRAEEGAMPLRIMNWIEALHQSTVPRISLIVRKSYGMAHCNMAGGNMGCDSVLAWPGADISFMAPAVAVNVVYGRKLAEMENASDTRDALMEEISRANAPWAAAGMNLIDKVIDPRDTRVELQRALARARGPEGRGGRSQRRLANWPRMA
jgi:acetyl-CoA carboxylase carboxyltransferase component